MTTELEHLSVRITKLEKKNSFLQRVIFSLTGIIFVSAFLGLRDNSTPKIIEAEKFVLRDENGHMKSAWYSDKDGDYNQSRLEFYTQKNDTSVVLGYKRNFNNPLFMMKENILGSKYEMNLKPGELKFGAYDSESEGDDGHVIHLTNIPYPWFGMSNGMEIFQLHMRDTGLVVGRYGANPQIFIESNEKEIIHLEQNLLRKKK